MQYRVSKPFKYTTARGDKKEALPGEIVDVMTEVQANELLQAGRVTHVDLPPLIAGHPLPPAAPTTRTCRLGLYLFTSPTYSGGRVHLFQYAQSFAANGGEVYYISNAMPRWAADYPNQHIHYVIWGQGLPPDDLDLIMTDGKGIAMGHASEYKRRHPATRLCIMNFETPNWVREFLPALANKISTGNKEAMRDADLLVVNSRESARHLAQWIGVQRPISVLQPAVNTHAVAVAMKSGKPKDLDRPYAVWSGRGQDYKGFDVAFNAVKAAPGPFDLVAFGTPTKLPIQQGPHRVHVYSQRSDVDKFTVMRYAQMTLAPSLFEGFGMVPSESLAVGTPVVAYDLPVLREEYGATPGLHLVKWNDAKAFTAKVAALASVTKPTLDPKPIIELLGMHAMAARVERLPYHTIKTKRVSAQLISYWGFIPEVLEAVYPHVDEIVIAFGPDKNATPLDDGSLERIRAFPDPAGKIKLEVRARWNDKRDMRQWCHDHSTGNYNLVLDGDEIWVGLDKWLAADVDFGCPRWVTMWHDAEHYVVAHPSWKGARWGDEIKPYGSICNHYRWSWLRRSYQWAFHCRIETAVKQPIRNRGDVAALAVPDCLIYHLGHVLPAAVMRAKHAFYKTRDGDDAGRRKREKAWHNWNGQLGDCGDGIVKLISWSLPDVVRRGVASAAKIAVRS